MINVSLPEHGKRMYSFQRGPNVDYASKIRVLSEKLQSDLCALKLYLQLSLIKLHQTYVILTKLITR